jgi:hypothetical protein
MRRVALAGIAILVLSIAISSVEYLTTGSLQWNPSDPSFIYSSVLTLGFIASIVAGLFGAFKENEEVLIVSGVACIAFALVNKFFINRLYSLGIPLDAMWLIAGILMIIDRYQVKITRERKQLEEKVKVERPSGRFDRLFGRFHLRRAGKAKEAQPEPLLNRFERLKAEAAVAETNKALSLEREIYDVKKMLWIEAMKKPELARTMRGQLYLSQVGQQIVTRFIDSDMKVVEPDIETAATPIYHKLADIEGYSQRKVQETLDQLAEVDILIRELYEKLVACPECHQPSKVFIRNKCSKCGSRKIHMNRLMEHSKCGAIYEEQQYNGHKCPKCENPIEERSELKPVGVAFHCESCENIFSDPPQSFYCRRCATEFELKNSELAETYSYTFNEGVKSEAKQLLAVATMATTLEKLGFDVTVRGSLKGRTGVSHEFTLTCNKGEKLVAIELLMAEPKKKVDTAMVLSSYAKFMDVPAATRLVVAIPSLESQTREFLNANQVLSIEGENLSEIDEKVKQILK